MGSEVTQLTPIDEGVGRRAYTIADLKMRCREGGGDQQVNLRPEDKFPVQRIR
jgi:hypothetical protein